MTPSLIPHTAANFELFLSQLAETNFRLSDYVDFSKVSANVEPIAIKLHTLDYLIGRDDLGRAVDALWRNDKSVFGVLPILIAVHEAAQKKALIGNRCQPVGSFGRSAEDVVYFLEHTGLAALLRTRQIRSLTDYVFGVEAGLDTNARKNRSGKLMASIAKAVLADAGIEYREEVSSAEFATVSAALGKDQKRFDFVIKTKRRTWLGETNFYSSGGSKLSEVARGYKNINAEISRCPGYQFVWVTDGVGWRTCKRTFFESYLTIPHLYNLTDIDHLVRLVQSEMQ